MFVPAGFEPPRLFSTSQFRLEPLGPEHNEADYAGWTSSIDHIKATPGFEDRGWPHRMTLAENLADLERHSRDFADRSGFTYTVLDPGDDVVGCVYVYPADDGVHDADARSWVTESRAELDAPLRRAVADWLTSDAWPFERPLYEPLLS